MYDRLAAFVLTLLALHRPPDVLRRRIEQRLDRIVWQLRDAHDQTGVPEPLLLAVAFLETHIGVDDNEGNCWGAPIDRRHRNIAGDHNSAARVLVRGWNYCRHVHARSYVGRDRVRIVRASAWMRAVAFYRCGACQCPHLLGYQAAGAFRLAEEIVRATDGDPSEWLHSELEEGLTVDP